MQSGGSLFGADKLLIKKAPNKLQCADLQYFEFKFF